MRALIGLLIFFLNVVCFSSDSVRQNTRHRATAASINGNIKVDGKLDEPEWQRARRYAISYEIHPGDNLPPRISSFFSVLYNKEYIYFAFYCFDPEPAKIRSNLSDRDKIYNDDFVAVILDSYQDNQRVYQYCSNPSGIQADLVRIGNNEDDSYDALWYSAGQILDSGYTVEMALPFKSLRYPDKPQQEWGLFAGRGYPRDNAYIYSWTPLDRNNPCFNCQAGVLEGLENLSANLSYEILPYVMGYQQSGLTDIDDPATPFERHPFSGRIGGGFKINPSSALIVEGVFNPDFSQIESDAQQISVNSTFSLYYPEKRPFFLEGADIFSSHQNYFYSRTINNPLFSSKISGKSGNLSYAYLLAKDRNTIITVPGDEGSSTVETGLNSFVNVARVRYDFGEETYLGAMATSRTEQGGFNITTGVDYKYLFWKNYYFRGLFLLSKTKELNDPALFDETRKFGTSGKNAAFNGESLFGSGAFLHLGQSARHHFFNIQYGDFSPQFQSHLGYLNRTNLRHGELEGGFIIYPDSSFLNQLRIFANYGLSANHRNVCYDQWIFLGTFLQFTRQSSVFIGVIPVNNEIYHSVRFTEIRRLDLGLSSRPFKFLNVSLNGKFGKFIYREDVPALGQGHELALRITVNPDEQLQIGAAYERARLSDAGTGELFYDGYIGRLTSSYQFDKAASVRLIIEYNSFDKGINVFPLFNYKINPFTIFYAGSTHNYNDYVGNKTFQLNDRQYFAKVQYLFNN